MLNSDGYLERGDGPAQAVLRANAEKQALRQAIETQEELQRIRERVCVTLSAYEFGGELQDNNQNNVEQLKNAFVKDDAELEFVDDMTKLYLILSDPIAKKKYQQKVTIFVVGYENLCSHRSKLLLQLQDFFNQSAEEDSSFLGDIPEFNLDEAGKNVRDALSKAEKTTERLASVSKEVLKVFELVNQKDHKKGKKKLEKAFFQSQQDVMNLTEKLLGVQSDLEDATNKLNTLNKQVELKDLDIERLKLQVNTNKAFEKESDDLRKALEAKEKQLQNYRLQMDEVELSLSQAEHKYDNCVKKCKNLKEENQKLSDELERKLKEQQQEIIETRKELELKYDEQVKELRASQEQLVAKLKESHEDEVKNLREKIDMMQRCSTSGAETSSTTPASRDSALHRYSTPGSDFSRTSTFKSSAGITKTLADVKNSARLSTASSQVSSNNDSVLKTSSSSFLSMASTPFTPKTAETQHHESVSRSLRDVGTSKTTVENWAQTSELNEDSSTLADVDQVKSRNELQEIEEQLSKTPTDELPWRFSEYKTKFLEIEQQLREEIVQWKLRFNAKTQALNQLFLTHQKEMKDKEHLFRQLAVAQEQRAQAEKDAASAVIQLEEYQAEKESIVERGDDTLHSCASTENKSTAISVSIHPKIEDEMMREEQLQATTDKVVHRSVEVQCPSSHSLRQASLTSLQYSESELAEGDEDVMIGVAASDSGFGGSGHVLASRSPEEANDTLTLKVDERTEISKPEVVLSASPRVRSRLVRSALKDHRVITESIRTYEMITQFKLDITLWLKHHGFQDKSDLFSALPDILLDKHDELDVLSKLPDIRNSTKLVTQADCFSQNDLIGYADHNVGEDSVDSGRNGGDVDDSDVSGNYHAGTDGNNSAGNDTVDADDRASSSRLTPDKTKEELYDGGLKVRINTKSVENNQRARSAQTERNLPRSPRTSPKGYTNLLREHNNLEEEYVRLQQQLQENLKSYQEQTSQNAAVMNEMRETINDLRWQLAESSSSDRTTRQVPSSCAMFTRLDAERNVKCMRRAVLSKRLSPDTFSDVVRQMSQYVDLPGRRLMELIKRYRHHCIMKELEESLYRSRTTSSAVYDLQGKMEYLQRQRAERWSEKMAEMGKRRSMLSDDLTSSLSEIEESSGIFLIKPVYSYFSRLQEVKKLPHPIVCKKKASSPKKSEDVPSECGRKAVLPFETTRTVGGYGLKDSDRRIWIAKNSQVSVSSTTLEHSPIPRLLAMDVNRVMLNKNPVSEQINMSSTESLAVHGVRQYVTVERPIGVMTSSKPDDGSPSPSSVLSSFSHYATLPPISLPNVPRHSSATPAFVKHSQSSVSMASIDETFVQQI